MSSSADHAGAAGRYDGLRGDDLEQRLGLPKVVAFATVGSTLDVAHLLAAEGAPAGTLVLADRQSAGRGRLGKSWRSELGAGVWLTLVERPNDLAALDVLSLRVGLALAPALDAFADGAVRLKWPNDVYADGRKLAGVLVEARWRDGLPEWVAIGVGVNVRAPEGEPNAIGLRSGVARLALLDAVIPAIRRAALCSGVLSNVELAEFAARDFAGGRACVEPVVGVVQGIDASGALCVRAAAGDVVVRAGSLVLNKEAP